MAMHSVSTKPSAPTKVGTLWRGLALRNSADGLVVSVSTSSSSRLLAFATARMAVERGLPWIEVVSYSARANEEKTRVGYPAPSETSHNIPGRCTAFRTPSLLVMMQETDEGIGQRKLSMEAKR
jgi:hypothetical protein